MAITSSHLLAVGKVAKKGRRKRKTKQKILDWKLSNLKMKRALQQRRRRRDCDDLVKSAWGTLMSRGMLTDDMTSLISSPPPTPSPTQTMAERQSSSEYEIDQYTIVFCFFVCCLVGHLVHLHVGHHIPFHVGHQQILLNQTQAVQSTSQPNGKSSSPKFVHVARAVFRYRLGSRRWSAFHPSADVTSTGNSKLQTVLNCTDHGAQKTESKAVVVVKFIWYSHSRQTDQTAWCTTSLNANVTTGLWWLEGHPSPACCRCNWIDWC